MKNKELVEMFVLGSTEGAGSNLKIKGRDLINYQTVIARRESGKILVTKKYHSVTTRRNKNFILNTAKEFDVEIEEVEQSELD